MFLESNWSNIGDRDSVDLIYSESMEKNKISVK